MAIFEVLINGEIKRYDSYDAIPKEFDNLIRFEPDISDGPHTEEEHQELEKWNDRLKALMEIERASSNKNR